MDVVSREDYEFQRRCIEVARVLGVEVRSTFLGKGFHYLRREIERGTGEGFISLSIIQAVERLIANQKEVTA